MTGWRLSLGTTIAIWRLIFPSLAWEPCCTPSICDCLLNAWGLPFACVYFGCKQVPPGPAPTSEVLVKLIEEYYKDGRTEESFRNGWLHTGDIAVVDPAMDLIKSGGEWISSVDLENTLMAHPSILEACVVGIPHLMWIERPLALVMLKNPAPQPADPEALLAYLEPKFPKWQLPDNIVYVPEIPKTSVGKFLKRQLREQYIGHYQDRDK